MTEKGEKLKYYKIKNEDVKFCIVIKYASD